MHIPDRANACSDLQPPAPASPGHGPAAQRSLAIPDGLAVPLWQFAQEGATGASGDRRYLLKYYTQVLSGLVTTNHENNSFLSGARGPPPLTPFPR